MNRKLAFAAAVFTAAVFALPAVAGAHIEVTADTPPASDGLVVTKVFSENECKHQLKTVDLVFPGSPALTVAAPADVVGWTHVVTKRSDGDAVASITWTNDGTATGNGTFPLSLGPVPAGEKSVKFKALDTCDDGEVFRWIQDGESSEFPAPVLDLASSGAKAPETSTGTKVPVTTTNQKSDSGSTGVVIGIVAASLVLIGAGVVMFRRSKK